MSGEVLVPDGLRGPALRAWYLAAWDDVVALQGRYARLRATIRPGWWTRAEERETLAALALWRRALDLEDPQFGEPAERARRAWELLRQLPAIAQHLASQPGTRGSFEPERERTAFDSWLAALPDSGSAPC
jgi:hypothetical protein